MDQFCCAWAGFWLTFGWFFLPFLNLHFIPVSLLAILIPVGKQRAVPVGYSSW